MPHFNITWNTSTREKHEVQLDTSDEMLRIEDLLDENT